MSSKLPLVGLRDARLEKLSALREMGINPFPSCSFRTHYIGHVVTGYEAHEGLAVTVAGRLMALRKHGKLTFGNVQDQTGSIQLYVKKDVMSPADPGRGMLGYGDLKLLDVGDFLEVRGEVTKTQRGEISVLVESLRLLTKSLRPMPDKWAGLKDREAILRKRYLDTTVQPEHKKPFEAVSRMVMEVRKFLDDLGFLEFHTPVIQPQYGGGTAKPFITHVNALNVDMYLAISHELYLKRLIAGGFDKVYTIGRYFRNEGMDSTHHPEFSMIETMTAYENYEYNMDLIEDMFRHVAQEVFDRMIFRVGNHDVDFGKPWNRISMNDAVKTETGHDFGCCNSVEQANSWLSELGIEEPAASIGEALAIAFEEKVGPTLIQPTLVHGHPVEISPLAKPVESDPRYAERFEIFIAGMECGDNWSEQNDPLQLLEMWKSQYKPEDRDEGEFHPLDYDFVEMLEHGMPPTTGIGPGIERMAMIFTEQENIDDVIVFPMLRPIISTANRAIYGIEPESEEEEIQEELLLTHEEFESLLSEKLLQPQTPEITITPFVRIWTWPSPRDRRVSSGHIEISGFLRSQLLKVVGFQIESEVSDSSDVVATRFCRDLEDRLVQDLKSEFTSLAIQFSEAQILADPISGVVGES